MFFSDSAFNAAIFQALCACLELSASSAEASSLIRPFPNDPENPPPPPRSANVIYYDVRPEEAPDAGYQSFTAEESATSIVATPHSGDRSFRLNSDSTKLPPLAVVESSSDSSSAKPAVSSFLPFRLILVCYGPDCERNAHRIRSFLFLDGSGYPRSILRKAGIYPVPRPSMPVLLDEEEGALLRKRADLTISLRVKDTLVRTNRRFGITEAPAVILKS